MNQLSGLRDAYKQNVHVFDERIMNIHFVIGRRRIRVSPCNISYVVSKEKPRCKIPMHGGSESVSDIRRIFKTT